MTVQAILTALLAIGAVVGGMALLRRLTAPKAGTRKLALLLWAAFGPYDDADDAVLNLRTACDVVFGSRLPAEEEKWVADLVNDVRNWASQGKLEAATKRMGRWLAFESYGDAFTVAQYEFRSKLLERLNEVAGRLSSEFPNLRPTLDGVVEQERDRLARESKERTS